MSLHETCTGMKNGHIHDILHAYLSSCWLPWTAFTGPGSVFGFDLNFKNWNLFFCPSFLSKLFSTDSSWLTSFLENRLFSDLLGVLLFAISAEPKVTEDAAGPAGVYTSRSYSSADDRFIKSWWKQSRRGREPRGWHLLTDDSLTAARAVSFCVWSSYAELRCGGATRPLRSNTQTASLPHCLQVSHHCHFMQ